MRRGLIFAVSLLAGAGVLGLGGCARFHDQPLSAEKSRADLEARTLADRRLKSFLETNLRTQSASWPLPSWNFTNLSRAAFYFHPDLDVARAQLVGAKAAGVTAGAKPNPTVSLTPIYDTTTGPPWILGLSIDVPIETMGKRGYRIAQAVHLSDAARFNLASTAWQVRSRVRKSLLALYAAGESESLLKKQEAITAEIPLANFPKQFEVEGNLIYVNVPAANHVAIVGRKEKTVVATWPVTAAKDNIPMGFDRARHRLFIGCVPGAPVRRHRVRPGCRRGAGRQLHGVRPVHGRRRGGRRG